MILADYVIDTVSRYCPHAFMVVGGGAMWLNDAVGRKMTYTAALHEQGAGYMAFGYAQVRNKLGLCVITSGPGATNAITPCLAAWDDSVPILFISGQVQTSQLKGDSGLRYKGTQEVDIISMVEHITKYAVTVKDPLMIKEHLYKAILLATTDRKAPVWLDIPLDVQGAEIE